MELEVSLLTMSLYDFLKDWRQRLPTPMMTDAVKCNTNTDRTFLSGQ